MKNLNSVLNESWTRLDTDVLILGSGLAGLLLSILLHDRGASVVLASKETFSDSNTFYAQGGLAAVTSTNFLDSPQEHLSDTIKSGAGLTDAVVANDLIQTAPHLVRELTRLGMSFDRNHDGAFELAREGGHSKARVLHSKDTTGKAISNALLENATEKASRAKSGNAATSGNAAAPQFTVLEYCFAGTLLTDRQGVVGTEVLHGGVIRRIYAKHVVLATGGAGQIFSRTTNPLVATADGVALAYRAGAMLADLEFVQFHPTALALPGAPAFLISEAVRGAGAVLLDPDYKPFMKNFHKDADLATRDVVARAIHKTMLNSGLPSVNLDLRLIGKQKLLDRFPNIVTTCRRFGVDPVEEPVPVCPAAHYFMGGILSDACGRTTLPGLYAIGEVASTGLHGANRLASNSLLEAGVMAIKLADLLCSGDLGLHKGDAGLRNGGESVLRTGGDAGLRIGGDAGLHSSGDTFWLPKSLTAFKSNMYGYASLTRNQNNLDKLLDHVRSERTPSASLNVANLSAANMLLVGELITTAARNRTESRGAHFREDFEQTNDALFCRRQAVSAGNWQWLDAPMSMQKIDKQSTFAHKGD